MKFGYITINGRIATIFLNKPDEEIQRHMQILRESLESKNINAIVDWNNFWSDKSMDDLVEFMRTAL